MKNIKNFIERWQNHGYEKGESQKFWIDLLEMLGVKNNLHKKIPPARRIFLWKNFYL